VALLAVAAGCVLAGSDARPPAQPAEIEIAVSPAAVAPGGQADVTLRLTPRQGIKINRYPKIKFRVEERSGLVAAGEAALGNDKPPPPQQMSSNYFDQVEPLRLSLSIDEAASSGRHELDAHLTYFYCVTRSGFCAPAKTPLKIALDVR